MFDFERATRQLEFLRATGPTYQWLEKAVGGLSKPSKMPWYSYSIPATRCKVGSVLQGIEGSVCANCYAMKGRYRFGTVQNALENRYAIMTADYAKWAGTMAFLIHERSGGKLQHFRWHDSGDLQGEEHLQAIIWIAQQVPWVRFWLPTKERKLVIRNTYPLETAPNLLVRVSATMVGALNARGHFPTSGVGASGDDHLYGTKCPAKSQGGKCGTCRACWNKEVTNVNYPEH